MTDASESSGEPPHTVPERMPRRPRQHDLETASRRAFESLLPDAWVARAQQSEYGVDFYVEVFVDGSATGRVFGVQLKATERVAGTPSARIKWSTWNYWAALRMPILVLLWDAATRTFWWEWSHRFDTAFVDDASEAFPFTFHARRVWHDETTPSEIDTEVIAWRAWEEAQQHLPLSVVVRATAERIGGSVPAGVFVSALRSRLGDLRDALVVRSVPLGSLHISIDISSTATVVWVSGGGSATLHHEEFGSAMEVDRALIASWSADVLMVVATRLDMLGLSVVAARAVSRAMEDASLVFQPQVATTSVRLLLQASRFDDAVALLARLESSTDTAAMIGGAIGLLSSSVPVDTSDRKRASDTFEALADAYALRGETGRAAALAYTASTFVGRIDGDAAVRLLERAADLDSAYLKRGYWHRERSGYCSILATMRRQPMAMPQPLDSATSAR